MPVAIALADDSLIVREGLSQMLGDQAGLDLVASCPDLPSLLAAIDDVSPDVVSSN